jgi:aspartate kinase
LDEAMTQPGSLLVVKFGGTSVGSAAAIRQAADLVKTTLVDWPRQVVVVSAMSGVTNQLLSTALEAAEGNTTGASEAAQALSRRHLGALAELISDPDQRLLVTADVTVLIEEFLSLCQAIAVLGEASPRALDSVGSIGERLSVRIVAAALRSMGVAALHVDAADLIVTDDSFQDAHPDLEATRDKATEKLGRILLEGIVPVVTGFMAATRSGITTTLGRGGSDYSAALLGTALRADEVWIWTDVDGVMTADPRMVPEAQTISRLSYLEVAELAYFGAKVLHPKTIRPVIEAGIALRICNTFSPKNPGTRVVSGDNRPIPGKIKAVTAIRKQKLITIEGRGMIGVPGVAARAFGAVAATGTSVILITQASSEQSICFSVPSDSVPQVIQHLEDAFAKELEKLDIDSIWATEETVIVTVVGAGLRHTPGIAGKIFTALGDAGVNVIAIAQGSSEVAISMVVTDEQAETAVRALHALIVSPESVR